MRGVWAFATASVLVAACATLSGLDELGVCDGSTCVDASAIDGPAESATDADVDAKDAAPRLDADADAADAQAKYPVLQCGTMTCVLDGGTACCTTDASAFCIDPADCTGSTLLCTGKATCTDGGVCCGSAAPNGYAFCMPSCTTQYPLQLCNTKIDPPPVCPQNETCQPYMGYSICK